MKIGIIGAAGVRTPLLVRGLADAAPSLRLQELALFDPDQERLQPVARLARAMAARQGLTARLVPVTRPEAAIEGAEFVISSIRVGGIAARVQDEQIALAHGLVGQETVGAGGFACALRNLQAMLVYGRLMMAHAPRAKLINFTNPVGIVSQALLSLDISVLGVCDTPLEMFEQAAQALDRDPFSLRFDYFGLNHLGWVKHIWERRENGDRDLLPELLQSPDRIQRCYRHGLFPADWIQRLGLLPTEYLYFYYFPEQARDNTRRSGQSRGQMLEKLNDEFFRRLALTAETDLLNAYENYLRERNASYMSIEASAGEKRDDQRPLYSAFSGYERIAVLLLTALQSEQPRVVPLTLRNDGALTDLEPGDSVELPCQVSRAGVAAWRAGAAPPQVRDLLVQVKRYERLTAAAAVTHQRGVAEQALAANPLVGATAAPALLRAYEQAFGSTLGVSPI